MSGMVNLHHIEIVRQYGQTIASRCAGAHPVRRGAHPKTGAALWKIPRKKPRHRRAHGFAAERTYGHPPRGGGVQHVKIPIYIMHIHPGSRCRLMPSYETRETAARVYRLARLGLPDRGKDPLTLVGDAGQSVHGAEGGTTSLGPGRTSGDNERPCLDAFFTLRRAG